MKLCRFTAEGVTRLGRIDASYVVDLSRIDRLDGSMRHLLTNFDARRAERADTPGASFALDTVTLEAPIDDPQKFLAIGMNYQKHAERAAAAGIPVLTSQLWFNKQVSCITGPSAPIDLPEVSEKLDYEAELAFVGAFSKQPLSISGIHASAAGRAAWGH